MAVVIPVTTSQNIFLNALQLGHVWDDGDLLPGTNIKFGIGAGNVDLNSMLLPPITVTDDSLSWSADGIAAVRGAFQTWSTVANITFTETTNPAEVDIVEFVANFTNPTYSSLFGLHEASSIAYITDFTAWGVMNALSVGFNTVAALQPGGIGFTTLLHEIGHALGLAHPHDTFQPYNLSSLFPGVTNLDPADLGDNNLNQGIFTIMSYNQSWKTVIGTPPPTIGQVSTPMAFDIAAIQYLYGAKASSPGGTTYSLLSGVPELKCIWDTGGVDQIVYGGSFATVVDLRAATLANAPGGGGFVSYVYGAPASSLQHWKGFTIANGVTIENAKGGTGKDFLIGNNGNNVLTGLHGNDNIVGNNGVDTLIGGHGLDVLNGGAHRDIYDFNIVAETKVGAQRDVISHFQRSLDDIDLRTLDARSGVAGNQAFKWIGTQAFHKVKGELKYKDLGASCLVQGDINGDGRPDFEIMVKVGALGAGDFLL